MKAFDMAPKRLEKYPEQVRKIKRLRKQIRDLNRAIRKLRPQPFSLDYIRFKDWQKRNG